MTTSPSLTDLRPTDDEVARAVDHLVALMAADSTSGQEAPGVDACEAICEGLGLPVRRQRVADGRDNLLIGAEDPKIVLCTHLDTVPPFIAPRVERHADSGAATRIYGRGACDAKGIAVSMLYALMKLRAGSNLAENAVACWLVVGEETDHSGAKIAAAGDRRPDVIILGEPCGVAPARAQKGLLKLELTATGVAGHSAYPELGQSANHLLLAALNRLITATLPADPLLGETTVNVGTLHGGLAANVIAPRAKATVLIRCAAPVDAVLSAATECVSPKIEVTELSRAEPIEFEVVGQRPGPTVPFNTDGHTLSPLGAKLVLMGPGDMRCAHGEHEELSVKDLGDGIAAYAAMVSRLL